MSMYIHGHVVCGLLYDVHVVIVHVHVHVVIVHVVMLYIIHPILLKETSAGPNSTPLKSVHNTTPSEMRTPP